eukprot:SAG11_NODE_2511_length_3268_cov_4.738403_2_plen_125_part_00
MIMMAAALRRYLTGIPMTRTSALPQMPSSACEQAAPSMKFLDQTSPHSVVVLLLSLLFAGRVVAAVIARKNVLHMVADDLRTELSLAYNHPEVHTPNLDALTKKSMVFQHAYCQQPICSPSRNR